MPTISSSKQDDHTSSRLAAALEANEKLEAQLKETQQSYATTKDKLDEMGYITDDLKTRWLNAQHEANTLRDKLEESTKQNEEYRLQLAALNATVDKLMVKVTDAPHQPKQTTNLFGKIKGRAPSQSTSKGVSGAEVQSSPAQSNESHVLGLSSHGESVNPFDEEEGEEEGGEESRYVDSSAAKHSDNLNPFDE